MKPPRCWWCGVAPERTIDASTYADPHAVIHNWPPTSDHDHAATPPTPAQLVDDGHRRLRHILEGTL